MCTVTVIPYGDTLIITMNRDEAKCRAESAPLITQLSNEHFGWFPIDNTSRGTWCGVNNFGVVAMLLNRYQESNLLARRSRGNLVPTALRLQNLSDIRTDALAINWQAYAPCDLLLAQGKQWVRFSWSGDHCHQTEGSFDQPFILTSSSVDIADATDWRYKSFSMFIGEKLDADANTALNFHLTTCPGNPSLGIFMQREQRHTKSITQIQLSHKSIKARYFSESAIEKNNFSSDWDLTWPIVRHRLPS